jgi:hypothetical protein
MYVRVVGRLLPITLVPLARGFRPARIVTDTSIEAMLGSTIPSSAIFSRDRDAVN